MAKTFTNDEKREIEEKAKYILTAMDDIGKNGDAYCTDEHLFRASKAVRPNLTGPQYHTDKTLLLQAEFLHREGYHLYAQRTWAYEVTAVKRLADILKDPTLPVLAIPKELRVGDILDRFEEKYQAAKSRHLATLKGMGWTDFDGLEEVEKHWMEGVEYLKGFHFTDSEHEINHLLRDGKSILCEGAQGTMLDVDFGSYPFVTSSNTIGAGACTGLGIGANKVGNVFGIMKAYCTRVGSGPFPTELFDETGKRMRDIGHEYGAVTGRERRCGWIDLVQLRYSIMVDGVTELIMMKSDVLDTFDTIKACVAYRLPDGTETDELPFELEGVTPIYKEMKGWKTDMTQYTSEDQFPQEFKDYIRFLEDFLETRIGIISIGPDREQTIVRG